MVYPDFLIIIIVVVSFQEDNIWGTDYDYYSNEDVIRYYYQEFVSTMTGDIDGEIIDLTVVN